MSNHITNLGVLSYNLSRIIIEVRIDNLTHFHVILEKLHDL